MTKLICRPECPQNSSNTSPPGAYVVRLSLYLMSPYGHLAHVLWQQRCLEVDSRLHHVWVVDERRRTYRHQGRQHDAPRRIATFHHATLRVAPHRYATLEPPGKPGGSRASSADGPPQ